MRGRQAAYPDIAVNKLQRIITELEDVSKPDGDVKIRGPFAYVTLIAK
jgi:translation initiation factor IF-3